ncbi:hypothetical protein KI387_010566, partial [Taxus chinensis]
SNPANNLFICNVMLLQNNRNEGANEQINHSGHHAEDRCGQSYVPVFLLQACRQYAQT